MFVLGNGQGQHFFFEVDRKLSTWPGVFSYFMVIFSNSSSVLTARWIAWNFKYKQSIILPVERASLKPKGSDPNSVSNPALPSYHSPLVNGNGTKFAIPPPAQADVVDSLSLRCGKTLKLGWHRHPGWFTITQRHFSRYPPQNLRWKSRHSASESSTEGFSFWLPLTITDFFWESRCGCADLWFLSAWKGSTTCTTLGMEANLNKYDAGKRWVIYLPAAAAAK